MELVYFFGKKYGVLSKVEMNFNPQFTFRYDEKKCEIFFGKNKDELNIFSDRYENISNVNAIVGENGRGKTTFLRFLIDAFRVEFSRGAGMVDLQYLMILFDGESFRVYDNLSASIKMLDNTMYSFKSYPKTRFLSERPDPPMCLAYYTNTFSFSEYRENGPGSIDQKFYNMSLSYLLHQCSVDDKGAQDPIKYAQHLATKRQIDAWPIWNKRKGLLHQPQLCVHIVANGSNYHVVRDFIAAYWKPQGDEQETKEELLSVCSGIYQNRFIGREIAVLQGVVYSLLQWLLLDASLRGKKRSGMMKDTVEQWRYFWGVQLLSDNIDVSFIMQYVEDFFDRLGANLDCKANFQSYIDGYRKTIEILLDKDSVDFADNGVFSIQGSVLPEFYESYQAAMGRIHEFISFDWGMSTGEFARFDFFACIYAFHKRANDPDVNKSLRSDSFLFLFDEADLYLHPRWQQSFLGDLLKDMKNFFPKQKIQILFTTHSPIFLSDIPAKHVFYFSESNTTGGLSIEKPQGRTFAANIYNLYKDAFFLNKSFVQTGSFALDVVTEIYKEWKGLCANDKPIKDDEILAKIKKQAQIVDMIGEDVIRRALYNLYLRLAKRIAGTDNGLSLYEMTISDYLDKSSDEQKEIKEKIIKTKGL